MTETKKWHMKLDDLVRAIVRQRDCPDGFGHCFVCGKPGHVSQMEDMHFVKRGDHTVRWDLRNNHMGCKYCNRFDQDHFSNYRYKMLQLYGEEVVNELIFRGRQILKAFPFELEELYESLKSEQKRILENK